MDIHIAAFRSRIGRFNSSGHHSYITDKLRKQSYKSASRTTYNFRRLVMCLVIFISVMSSLEVQPGVMPDPVQTSYSQGCLASSTPPVSFIVLGGQDSAELFPIHHLSFHDVLAVHSAATLQGVLAGHLDKGWIVAALPLRHSILSDRSF